jgi:hypothetical protein
MCDSVNQCLCMFRSSGLCILLLYFSRLMYVTSCFLLGLCFVVYSRLLFVNISFMVIETDLNVTYTFRILPNVLITTRPVNFIIIRHLGISGPLFFYSCTRTGETRNTYKLQ